MEKRGETLGRLAPMFKALSDETRLRILALLSRRGELCVCDFEGLLGISQSKSSRHLRYLYNAGLVQCRQGGKWMYYRLPQAPSPEAGVLLGTLDALVDDALWESIDARLKAHFARKAREGVPSCAPPRAPSRAARPSARRSRG